MSFQFMIPRFRSARPRLHVAQQGLDSTARGDNRGNARRGKLNRFLLGALSPAEKIRLVSRKVNSVWFVEIKLLNLLA